jgi:hypothetical protein
VKEKDHWRTVFDRAHLRGRRAIEIDLPGIPIDTLRFVIKGSFTSGGPRNVADIEEIVFPGYRAVFE